MIIRFSIFGNAYYFTFKFIGLTCIFVLIFSSLGLWQCHRAQQKRLLIQAHATRLHQQALVFTNIYGMGEGQRFYPVQLKGHFDNQHQIFLDNKTHQGQVGYEVYTPFLVEGQSKAILIDRGWVPAHQNRSILPEIKPISALIAIKGVLNTPPSYFSLGSMTDNSKNPFPLRVQYINLQALAAILGKPLLPYIVWLDPADPHGFERQWKVNLMGPEKHIMYAVQWFAFAISLLVIFGVLNLHKVKK